MRVNNTEVEDATLELLPFYYAKLVITALSPEWALTAARAINHFHFSGIVEKLELNQEINEIDYFLSPRIGIDQFLEHSDTPDYRPGVSILIGAYDLETLKSEVLKRIYALNCPTVSIFDGFYNESMSDETFSVENLIQIISGNTAIKAKMRDLIILSIPTTEGTPCRIQPAFKIKKGFMGANLLICGVNHKDTLKATMNAVDAIQAFKNVFCPYPAGINRLGTKFGSKEYYPTLIDKVTETKVPRGVKCIYEIEINGIEIEQIKQALKAGIEMATQVPGIKKIMSRGGVGKLSGKKIRIQEIFE